MHITLPAGQAVRINSATRPPTILACTVFVYERDRLCTAMRLCLRWVYTFSPTLTVCTFTTTRRDCITASQFTSDGSRTSPLVARIWFFYFPGCRNCFGPRSPRDLSGRIRAFNTRHDQYEDMNMGNLPLEKTLVLFCFLPFLLFLQHGLEPRYPHQP